MDAENAAPTLLSSAPKPATADELLLRRFRSGLKWCALDCSTSLARTASYLTFITLAVVAPITFSLLFPHPTAADCINKLSLNQLSQLSESVLAAISFLTLTSSFSRATRIQQLLLSDGLGHDSAAVRRRYVCQIDHVFRYLTAILLPSFSIELAHKIALFDVPAATPTWRAAVVAATVASWVYRTGVFLLVCALFRLTCELQILRFEQLYEMFAGGGGGSAGEEAAAVMFKEHVRIRMQLKAASHGYRIFIIGCSATITISQLGALLMVLVTKAEKSFSNSGDLVVCSVVQLSGFLMCLFGAARITHRAQRVVSIASQWHMILSSSCSTKLQSNADLDESDGHDWDPNHSFPPSIPQARPSLESRQALVTYLQHNGGGITIFGFALDRSLLHTLFAFEMSLVLWILSKVIVLT